MSGPDEVSEKRVQSRRLGALSNPERAPF
ncbi:hypothetical protein CTAM01_17281 [Colletotrichum tamarilloi]|uniref:Uncharacterized protein n=1 Tax=Colletotrichum tamarilloi TaxID=1209934 RepID=A0ABQ9QG26_9PEZI|nr:hypothetical protein CTAM01_17281 [Colletotrichum tamarilloi]